MKISAAALPPIQPPINDRDRLDPLLAKYQAYRSAMSCQLVEASSFADWKRHGEHQAVTETAAKHPHYQNFLQWMRENKGGARKCPEGNSFPANFNYWLKGGRW